MARHGVFIVVGYVGMVFSRETAPNKLSRHAEIDYS